MELWLRFALIARIQRGGSLRRTPSAYGEIIPLAHFPKDENKVGTKGLWNGGGLLFGGASRIVATQTAPR